MQQASFQRSLSIELELNLMKVNMHYYPALVYAGSRVAAGGTRLL